MLRATRSLGTFDVTILHSPRQCNIHSTLISGTTIYHALAHARRLSRFVLNLNATKIHLALVCSPARLELLIHGIQQQIDESHDTLAVLSCYRPYWKKIRVNGCQSFFDRFSEREVFKHLLRSASFSRFGSARHIVKPTGHLF